jgi:signal transduction histidine kinase
LPDGTRPLEADRAAFADVATILVENAAIAGARAITIEVRAEGDAVVVVVEDDGPGVPAAIEARLFEPFVTGRGRDAAHPGTGLGLAIAARWVTRHGGTLRHERPGHTANAANAANASPSAGGARFVARWPRPA